MKQLYIISILIIAHLYGLAQMGYNIKVSIPNFKNQYVYLGYYFGSTLPIRDSILLNDKGNGTFVGAIPLPGGIYLLGYPNKSDKVELLIDVNRYFTVILPNPNDKKSMRLVGSPEGAQFMVYQNYMEVQGKAVQALKETPNATAAEKAKIAAQRKTINDAVNAYREGIIKKNPKALLATIFNALKEPVIPEATKLQAGKYDSTYAWYYYKSNYWNGVSFTDDRLLRTPVYEPKWDNYFKQILYQSPDSIIKEVDKILIASMPNTEMFKYHTSKLIDRYINPEYMGQDAVFVHIFEKYVAPGTADWFTEKQKKYIYDRGYSLMANKLGDKAPPLNLVDTNGTALNLYNLQAKYTVLCFWDATCGHCKEVVPKLDSIYTAKWKNMGVQVIGIMTDGGLPAWKQYITQNKLTTWLHAYQPDDVRKQENAAGKANFRQLYDIVTTPKLYLLDKDKHIKAKQLTYLQLDDMLSKLNN